MGWSLSSSQSVNQDADVSFLVETGASKYCVPHPEVLCQVKSNRGLLGRFCPHEPRVAEYYSFSPTHAKSLLGEDMECSSAPGYIPARRSAMYDRSETVGDMILHSRLFPACSCPILF